MANYFDHYLARNIKNWMANQRPPENGRARLLRQAAEMKANPQGKPVTLQKLYALQCSAYHPRGEWLFGPITQTRLWSFHVATTYRLVT